MNRADLRATLRAIADGAPAPGEQPARTTLDAAAVKRGQSAFAAWQRFVRATERDQGEPLVAPAATLTPLP
jgi:hypothetical protein